MKKKSIRFEKLFLDYIIIMLIKRGKIGSLGREEDGDRGG